MKEKPFGYIILENDNSVAETTNVEVIEKPQLFYVRFNTVLQSLDCNNRNKRNYNGNALVEGLSTPEINELIANKKWKGECDHPITKDIQRIATVLSTKCSHYITKWWRDGNLIKGTIESIADGEGLYGTALARRVLQNENPSFSLRALAMLEKSGNITYVNKPPRVITYDEVNLPSHKEAYAEPKKQKVLDDGEKQFVYENGAIAIDAGDIKDMLVTKSDNLKIVCESFDIDPMSIGITNDGDMLTIKNGSDKIVFTPEKKLAREISNYFSYMTR